MIVNIIVTRIPHPTKYVRVMIIMKQGMMASKNNSYWKLEVLLYGEIFVIV